MADSNDRTVGLTKLQAKDNHVHANDNGHTVDVPPAPMKNPSLSQRFENSPLDPNEGYSPSRCAYLRTMKLPYVSLLRKGNGGPLFIILYAIPTALMNIGRGGEVGNFKPQVGAEIISTYILVFTGCGAVVVNAKSNGAVTHLGVSIAFGIVIMIMIYAVGHISGAHMNPAVTIAFATVRHFPWKDVPFYIGGQIAAGICAGFSLRLIFGDHANLGATVPSGSTMQSFVLELIIGFTLMFVVSAVATDTRAVGELAGLAIGSTVALNALYAGPISGASMNPARSIGPAVAANDYRQIWAYVVGPTVGCVVGALGYNLIRGSQPTIVEMETMKTAKSFRR